MFWRTKSFHTHLNILLTLTCFTLHLFSLFCFAFSCHSFYLFIFLLLLSVPATANFVVFFHCSFSFYCFLMKQTPTLSMSASQSLGGEDMSEDVWLVCKRASKKKKKENSREVRRKRRTKNKCQELLGLICTFFEEFIC